MDQNKLHLLVCRNLAGEMEAVLKTESFEDVRLELYAAGCQCLPAERRPMADAIRANKGRNGNWRLVGCDGPAGADRTSNQWRLFDQPQIGQCCEMLVGRSVAESLVKEGAYLLTPGWLAHWRKALASWGFQTETAREFFAEAITRLVLLDSGVDTESPRHLREFADYVQRPSQILTVGLDHFRLFLTNTVFQWRLKNQQQSSETELMEANRRLADYAMMNDLIGRMTAMKSEYQVMDAIFELFTMLFAPARLIYVAVGEGRPMIVRSIPAALAQDPEHAKRLLKQRQKHAWTESERGFLLRIGQENDPVGILEADDLAFPDNRQHYLNLALGLSQVCGLAIRNARTYEQLASIIVELEGALANVRTLSGLLPICASCKKIRNDKGYWDQIETYISTHSNARFSHGLCPDCLHKHYPQFATKYPKVPPP